MCLSKAKFAGLILSTVILSAVVRAADIPLTMTAEIDKEKIVIGDKFTLIVKVQTSKSIEIMNFNPIEALSQSFEVKDYKTTGPKKSWDRLKYEYRYVLSTFTTGKYKIPEMVLEYRKKGEDEIRQFKTAPIFIEIESVPSRPGDKDDIRDLKGIEHLGISPWWYAAGIFIILSSAGYYLWIIMKKRREKILFKDIEDVRPAEEIAFQKLRELKESSLISDGNAKQYYIYLADIIKSYLEKRFTMKTMDKTTMELYKEMKISDADRKIVSEVKSLLDDCDLVKFAKYIPCSREIESNWQSAFDIVDKTKPLSTSEVDKNPAGVSG